MIDLDSTPARYRGTIEVYVDKIYSRGVAFDTEWRWRCRSRNGQILGHGEGYRRKGGALNAIDAMFGARIAAEILWDYHIEEAVELPWRLVIVDRHHDTTTGAVY